MFFGYSLSQNIYLCHELQIHCVYLSRHVIHETIFPCSTNTSIELESPEPLCAEQIFPHTDLILQTLPSMEPHKPMPIKIVRSIDSQLSQSLGMVSSPSLSFLKHPNSVTVVHSSFLCITTPYLKAKLHLKI